MNAKESFKSEMAHTHIGDDYSDECECHAIWDDEGTTCTFCLQKQEIKKLKERIVFLETENEALKVSLLERTRLTIGRQIYK